MLFYYRMADVIVIAVLIGALYARTRTFLFPKKQKEIRKDGNQNGGNKKSYTGGCIITPRGGYCWSGFDTNRQMYIGADTSVRSASEFA